MKKKLDFVPDGNNRLPVYICAYVYREYGGWNIHHFWDEDKTNYSASDGTVSTTETHSYVRSDYAVSLYEALTNLRESQKAYMKDRGNEKLGKEVADRSKEADEVLEANRDWYETFITDF